ncbi:MAG: hypothetical protein Kow00120_16460 [Anaerolineae bacterium]
MLGHIRVSPRRFAVGMGVAALLTVAVIAKLILLETLLSYGVAAGVAAVPVLLVALMLWASLR